ncbi:MAG: GyrI-like domain-containing protein, partial [Ginsengibacter sp.]
LLTIKEDSVAIEWNGAIKAGLNPVSRIKSYYEAKKIQNNMADILKALRTYLEKKENVYGMNISQEKVVDTILISTKYISNTYPATAEIYSLINDLRKYISEAGAEETNPPMLNIADDNNSYRTMVAIPINKIIPEKGNYVFKRMIPGKILVAQVNGGEYTAREALKQIDFYITDNNLSSPAMPFESLITNRSQQPDTTKWVTKIYYPIY